VSTTALYQWTAQIEGRLTGFGAWQARGLAVYSYGVMKSRQSAPGKVAAQLGVARPAHAGRHPRYHYRTRLQESGGSRQLSISCGATPTANRGASSPTVPTSTPGAMPNATGRRLPSVTSTAMAGNGNPPQVHPGPCHPAPACPCRRLCLCAFFRRARLRRPALTSLSFASVYACFPYCAKPPSSLPCFGAFSIPPLPVPNLSVHEPGALAGGLRSTANGEGRYVALNYGFHRIAFLAKIQRRKS
jgi:hypothetical protein